MLHAIQILMVGSHNLDVIQILIVDFHIHYETQSVIVGSHILDAIQILKIEWHIPGPHILLAGSHSVLELVCYILGCGVADWAVHCIHLAKVVVRDRLSVVVCLFESRLNVVCHIHLTMKLPPDLLLDLSLLVLEVRQAVH